MSLPNPISYHVLDKGRYLPLPPASYDYVLARGGVYKRTDTGHLRAVIEVAVGHVAGLIMLEPYVMLHVPAIPEYWLRQVLDHARRATDRPAVPGKLARMVEAMYHFHHLPNGWRVAVPRQVASGANVSYLGGDAASIVLDLHSHHEMPAYFSRTDDRDEQGCRFYAVIGHIYSRPEIRLRLGIYGDFMDLPASMLFDDLGGFCDVYQEK